MLNEIGWIVAVNLALYLKTLRFKFVSDDFSCWKNPPVAKNAWHRLWLQVTGQMKIYATSIKFIRTNGKWFVALVKTEEMEHFLALVLHIAICICIYLAFGANPISFTAALLYSVNPVNNQGTIWPSGRGYVFPILFLLLSMIVPFYVAPLCLFAGAWYTAGFLPPLALIGSEHWMLLGFMPVVWLLHSRKFRKAVQNKRTTECFKEDSLVHPKKLILAVKSFGFYLVLCLVPFRITFYHNFLQSSAGSMKHKNYTLCRFFWIGFLALSGMLWYGVHQWDRFIWALTAFLITIFPFCNLWRANQEIAERFAALPNVFLMYALAQLISGHPLVVTAFLVFYATRTFYTLKTYQDEYWITEMAVVEDPHAWWAWHCRAMKRWDTQSYREALILWVMAKIISPNEFKVLMNIATCLRLLRNDKEAEEYLALAEKNIVPGQEEQALQFIAEHRKGKFPILL